MEFVQAQLALLVERLIVIGIIVIVALVALRVGRALIRRAMAAMDARAEAETPTDERAEVHKRMATVEALLTWLLAAAVIVVAGLMILSRLGVDIGPAIAGLGVAGIAIGFGAQAIVRDYFSGLLILLENQFARGDIVTIAGVTGTVEEITLRRTVLRDADGIVLNVPNGEIKVAANRTRVWRRINQDVLIAYGQDVDRVIAILDALCQQLADEPVWKERILEVPRVDRVDRMGEQGLTLKILGTVRAADLPAVSSELRKRIAAALVANAIRSPGVDTASGASGAA